MSVEYLDALRTELLSAGITGRRRDRIVIELADHLACDPVRDPAVQLGAPRDLARQFAAGVAVAIALAGAAGDDLYDGIIRGAADGLVCLAGFATLGRYLGLWSPGGSLVEPRPRVRAGL